MMVVQWLVRGVAGQLHIPDERGRSAKKGRFVSTKENGGLKNASLLLLLLFVCLDGAKRTQVCVCVDDDCDGTKMADVKKTKQVEYT
jgi:hypothetical protein